MKHASRDYQREGTDAVYREWFEKGIASTLLVLPTGTGKTHVAATIVDEHRDKSIWFLAHRTELIDQACDRLEAVLGYRPQVEQAERAIDGNQFWGSGLIVVASVQTIYRDKRLEKFRKSPPDIVITDEAHHAPARTYRKIYDFCREMNPNCKFLGLTATPGRTDKIALGNVFESVAYQMTIVDAIDLGWLVAPRAELVEVQDVHLDAVHSQRNEYGESDFVQSELAAIFSEEKVAHGIAKPLLEKGGDRRGPIFCAGVNPSIILSAVLNRYKPGCAGALHCDTPWDERRRMLEDLAHGRIQFICNFGILTEGWDSPVSDLIGLARPTKSPQVATQMVGRILRPWQGIVDGLGCPADGKLAIANSPKPWALVLDFTATTRHKLVTVHDVLGGLLFTPEEIARAKEESKQRTQLDADALEELRRARVEMLLEKEQQRRRIVRATVSYSTFKTNLLGKGSTPHVSMDVNTGLKRGGSTDGQIAYLKRLGVSYEKAARFTKSQAGAVIDKLKRERDAGPCTEKQRRYLIWKGENPNVNFATASRIIDEIEKNGGCRRDVYTVPDDEPKVQQDHVVPQVFVG
jgi:superfamily II DNA or RNA helicase